MSPTSVARQCLAAIALLCGACQRPSEPPKATAATPEAPKDEGERRADIVGASRIGTPAPALTLKTIDGQTIDLAKLYRHAVKLLPDTIDGQPPLPVPDECPLTCTSC